MSTVTQRLHVQRRAKGEVVLSADAPVDPKPRRRELKVALAWYIVELLDAGLVADQAELARVFGVSRARVTQAMRFLTAP